MSSSKPMHHPFNWQPTNLPVLERWFSAAGQLYGSDEHDQFVTHVLEELPHIMAELRYLREIERAANSVYGTAVNEPEKLAAPLNALVAAIDRGDPGPSPPPKIQTARRMRKPRAR